MYCPWPLRKYCCCCCCYYLPHYRKLRHRPRTCFGGRTGRTPHHTWWHMPSEPRLNGPASPRESNRRAGSVKGYSPTTCCCAGLLAIEPSSPPPLHGDHYWGLARSQNDAISRPCIAVPRLFRERIQVLAFLGATCEMLRAGVQRASEKLPLLSQRNEYCQEVTGGFLLPVLSFASPRRDAALNFKIVKR
jgi:hypothetical protein